MKKIFKNFSNFPYTTVHNLVLLRIGSTSCWHLTFSGTMSKKAGLTSHRHRKKSIRHLTFPITMWIIDIVELHQVMPCTNSQKCCFYAWLYFSMKIFIHFNVVISRVDKHWHFFPLWNSNTLLIIISFSKIQFPSLNSLCDDEKLKLCLLVW